MLLSQITLHKKYFKELIKDDKIIICYRRDLDKLYYGLMFPNKYNRDS